MKRLKKQNENRLKFKKKNTRSGQKWHENRYHPWRNSQNDLTSQERLINLRVKSEHFEQTWFKKAESLHPQPSLFVSAIYCSKSLLLWSPFLCGQKPGIHQKPKSWRPHQLLFWAVQHIIMSSTVAPSSERFHGWMEALELRGGGGRGGGGSEGFLIIF